MAINGVLIRKSMSWLLREEGGKEIVMETGGFTGLARQK